MIRMKCTVEGPRIITLDSCGLSKMKNGDIVTIKNEDLIQPEIQFLISKKILSVIEETTNPLVPEEKNYTKPLVSIYKCNAPSGRKVTLDSIKGTVEGGKFIEIKAADTNNEDVASAIRSNLLSIVQNEPIIPTVAQETKEVVNIEEQVEEVEENVEQTEEVEENIEQVEETEVQDIEFSDLKEIEEKEESPNFRVSEEVENSLQSLASSVYENNEEEKPKTRKSTSTTKPKRKIKRTVDANS